MLLLADSTCLYALSFRFRVFMAAFPMNLILLFRLSAEDACQIKDFESLEEYRMWAAFARTHGDRLYENESKRMLVR